MEDVSKADKNRAPSLRERRLEYAVAVATTVMCITATNTITYAKEEQVTKNKDITVDHCDGTVYIIIPAANVRTAPSTHDDKIIKSLHYGDEFHFDGYTSNGWYRVVTKDAENGNEIIGYIRGEQVFEC